MLSLWLLWFHLLCFILFCYYSAKLDSLIFLKHCFQSHSLPSKAFPIFVSLLMLFLFLLLFQVEFLVFFLIFIIFVQLGLSFVHLDQFLLFGLQLC